jgi:transposase InsO family protein
VKRRWPNWPPGIRSSGAFTGLLAQHNVRISIDGKGRYTDNIFVERLWRTVKYEEGLFRRQAGQDRDRRLLPLLQQPEAPSGPGLPDPNRGVQGRLAAISRTIDKEEVVTKWSIGEPWDDGGTLT